MTKRLCGRFLTLSIIIVLAACSSSNETATSPVVPTATITPAASDAPKATDSPTASPIATQTATPTATPQTGTSSAAPAPTPKPAATATPKPTVSDSDTSAAAAALFKQNCVTCHGVDLKGGFGPNLQKVGARLTKEQITTQIHDGGSDMPPFGKRLKAEEIQILADWLSLKKN